MGHYLFRNIFQDEKFMVKIHIKSKDVSDIIRDSLGFFLTFSYSQF